ncbi:DUF3108 domain-containing protein [Rhodohalobacter sp.]|uniref:DUF3108 domain-containing protein n=1 Tax=Rhodohalobacter sp. TaxID=1974210 RepID=UPI00356348B1
MMRTLLKHLLSNFLFLFLATVPVVFAQTDFTYERDREETPSTEEMLEAREVFEYEVRYGFFTLGWVDVELLPDTTYNDEKAYHLRTTMRSNSRLPFMGTKIVNYENIFQYNEKWPYSFVFWRDDVHDEEYDSARIIFDREADAVHFYEQGEPTDTLALEEPASGGDIIFYYSRKFAGLEEEYTLPAYIEGEMGLVTAKSGPKTEMREYDAFDEPIETYRSEGVADVDGPFGFNGKFKSWFSTDDLRVPVEAHVRVIFGNVKVRLINYERRGEN